MNRLKLRSPDKSRRQWEKAIKTAKQQRLEPSDTSSDQKIGRLSNTPNRLAAALVATVVLGGLSAKVVYPVVRGGEASSPIVANITPETSDRQQPEITGSRAKGIDEKQAEPKETSSSKDSGETAKQSRFIKVPKEALLVRADRSIPPRTPNNSSREETEQNATPTANNTSNQSQEAQAEHNGNYAENSSNTGGASAAQANKISTTEGVGGGAAYPTATATAGGVMAPTE